MKNNMLRWLTNFFAPPRESRLDLKRRSLLTAGVAGLGGEAERLLHTQAGQPHAALDALP